MSLHCFEHLVFSTFPELSGHDSCRCCAQSMFEEDLTPPVAATPITTRRRQRGVHFVLEDQNKVFYQTHPTKDDELCHELWYSRREIAEFRHNTHVLVDAIFQSTDMARHEWFMTILDAYMGLHEAVTTTNYGDTMDETIVDLWDGISPATDPELVGLDKYLLRQVFGGRHHNERRDYMYRNICTSSCRLTRFHCQTSCQASRPDRLLAQFVASMGER